MSIDIFLSKFRQKYIYNNFIYNNFIGKDVNKFARIPFKFQCSYAIILS